METLDSRSKPFGSPVASSRATPKRWPGSPLAISAMGRFDLARQYYESALAISPNDPALLSALAASLDSQGMRAEAAQVRAEVAQLQAASEALDAADARDPEPAVVQAAPSEAVWLPRLRRVKPVVTVASAPPAAAAPIVQAVPAGPTITVKLPPRAACRQRRRPAVQAQAAPDAPRAPLQLPQAVVDVRSEPPQYADRVPLRAVAQAAAASVTMALPPARPVPAAVVQAATHRASRTAAIANSSGRRALGAFAAPRADVAWRRRIDHLPGSDGLAAAGRLAHRAGHDRPLGAAEGGLGAAEHPPAECRSLSRAGRPHARLSARSRLAEDRDRRCVRDSAQPAWSTIRRIGRARHAAWPRSSASAPPRRPRGMSWSSCSAAMRPPGGPSRPADDFLGVARRERRGRDSSAGRAAGSCVDHRERGRARDPCRTARPGAADDRRGLSAWA